MNFTQIKEKLLLSLENQLEEISGNLLMEAEDGTGAHFEFKIGDEVFEVNMKTEYDEEKNEYVKEEYKILKINKYNV